MKEILHFTADWCNPCKRLKPIIEQYVKDNPDVKYTVIDVDTQFEIAEDYSVMSVPTLVIVKEDGKMSRHIGIASYQEIDSLVNG